MSQYITYCYEAPSGIELIMEVEYNFETVRLGYPSSRDQFAEAEDPCGDIEVVDIDLDMWEMNQSGYTPNEIRLATRFFRLWKDEILQHLNQHNERMSIFDQIAA
jgi:hypothetical protein